jgi:hypothetical protein
MRTFEHWRCFQIVHFVALKARSGVEMPVLCGWSTLRSCGDWPMGGEIGRNGIVNVWMESILILKSLVYSLI